MKKVSVLIVAIVIMLMIVQPVSAEVNLQLNGGYLSSIGSSTKEKGFEVGISGEYEIIPYLFSVAGEFSYARFKSDTQSYTGLNPEVLGRFTIFNFLGILELKLQAGVSYVHIRANREDANVNQSIFAGIGAFAEWNILPSLSLNADVRFPVYRWHKGYDNVVHNYFFKKFLVDLKVGLTYEIMPHLTVGIQGGYSNANSMSSAISGSNFIVGANLGYKF